MKGSEIKVGVVYGVRKTRRSSYGAARDVVPAKVVELDVPYEYRQSRYVASKVTSPGGGIRVRFVKPTRVGYSEFSLAARTNENAGPVEEEYVFGAKQGAGPVGQLFVGVWSELERARKDGERATADYRAQQAAKAAAFAPEMARIRDLFERVGVPASAVATYVTDSDEPYALSHAVSYGLTSSMLVRLVEIAAEHGETLAGADPEPED